MGQKQALIPGKAFSRRRGPAPNSSVPAVGFLEGGADRMWDRTEHGQGAPEGIRESSRRRIF